MEISRRSFLTSIAGLVALATVGRTPAMLITEGMTPKEYLADLIVQHFLKGELSLEQCNALLTDVHEGDSQEVQNALVVIEEFELHRGKEAYGR